MELWFDGDFWYISDLNGKDRFITRKEVIKMIEDNPDIIWELSDNGRYDIYKYLTDRKERARVTIEELFRTPMPDVFEILNLLKLIIGRKKVIDYITNNLKEQKFKDEEINDILEHLKNDL